MSEAQAKSTEPETLTAREQWVLRRAINRIELGLVQRPSPVGQRARELLTLAGVLVAEPSAQATGS